ncbi:MAG: CHAT domain-containing protein [Acidobacteria bacterium]|nr:MAG: CHAT domain-containing protein [Acidobacteriota bacterium]
MIMSKKLLAGLLVPWFSLLLADGARFSPLDLHHQLRDDYLAGRNVSAQIENYVEKTGDHSFDSLKLRTPKRTEGLKLDAAGKKAWFSQDYQSAVDLFSHSYRLFLEDGAASEAGFCLYYIAEILSEQERYVQALQVLEQASHEAADSLYLAALLDESAGFCLWFLDRLSESTHAFSRASDCWRRLAYADGLVGAWNNLAALHDELHLWDQSRLFYEKALEFEDSVQDDSIRYYLHANYASLLLQLKRPDEAKAHLEKARAFSRASPDEFLLIESQVEGLDNSEQRLLAFNPEAISLQIEKALLLAELYSGRDSPRALEATRQAIELSTTHQLRYHKRRSIVALGRLLESERRFEEAAELYQRGFKEEENLYSAELLFPYSRVVSPLFDGWVRCLVESRDNERALDGIRRLVALRRAKAEAVDPSISPMLYGKEGLGLLTQVARVEGKRLRTEWDDLAVHAATVRFPAHGGRPSPVLLELWPDVDHVYAWVTNSKGRVFRDLNLGATVNEILEPVLSALFTDGTYLPRMPDPGSLRRLYRLLVEPLVPFFDSDSLVVVVHKELQNLPLEMLVDGNGNYVLEDYHVSYLPLATGAVPNSVNRLPAPVLVFPKTNPELPSMEREALLLKSLFPHGRVIDKLDSALIGTPGWLHISSHFRLDPEFWLASGFDAVEGKTNALALLPAARSCALVSLGVCHAANAYALSSPYWLGFSELYLSRGATALVVSRWALDDLSMRIFRDFYIQCRQGTPMDQALTRARRRFLGLCLERDGVSTSGRHPYFWAGITYVGPPGVRLCETPESERVHSLTLGGLLMVPLALVGVAAILQRRARRGGVEKSSHPKALK